MHIILIRSTLWPMAGTHVQFVDESCCGRRHEVCIVQVRPCAYTSAHGSPPLYLHKICPSRPISPNSVPTEPPGAPAASKSMRRRSPAITTPNLSQSLTYSRTCALYALQSNELPVTTHLSCRDNTKVQCRGLKLALTLAPRAKHS